MPSLRQFFQALEAATARFSKGWKSAALALALAAAPDAEATTHRASEAQDVAAPPATSAFATVESPATVAEAQELWFPVGEELVYTIYWSALPVGETRCTTEWIEEDGRRLIRFRFRTRTNKVLAAIYPVDDVFESVVDPVTFLPVRSIKNLKAGRTRHHETTTFNWDTMEAHWESHLRNETRRVPLEPETRDIASLLYWMRRDGIEPGVELDLRVWADDKIHNVVVPPGEPERLRLGRYGKVQTVKIEPQANFQGVAVRKGRLWMWVTRDSRHLAAQISVEVPVARVHLVLEEVKGPGDDFWVSRKR